MRRFLVVATLLLLASQLGVLAQRPLPTTAPGTLADNPPRAARLGVTFINSIEHPISEKRYTQAILLGAGWTRWPLYWERVETSPGSFNWSTYDQLVSADLRYGFNINAILLGRPAFHQDGGSISGLSSPVFADGSDSLASGAGINPANPWANFVFQAVSRYKPGGLLAAQQGWPPGYGVRVWEAWNEPDLAMFWRGTVEQYARLLKVTYLAAHAADPDAQVMFGGLAYSNPEASDWLARVLAIYAQDADHAQHNWYMDMVGVHNYTYPRRSGEVVRRARENLARHGLVRPIWLNENGVPVWDDYPGPTWASSEPESRALRATAQQQAAFVIQSAAYAWGEGADVVIFHQLYDDCGNQRAGTDFPPHDGGLCNGGAACWGDAHGLFRNERDSVCFRQHPLPGTPRPAAFAYRLLAQLFSTPDFNATLPQADGRAVWVQFDTPVTRVYVAWNRGLQSAALSLPAVSQNAQVYTIDGQVNPLAAQEGVFNVQLPPASADDFPFLLAGDETGIGGQPLIVVERTGNIAPPPPTEPLNPALAPFPAPVEATRQPLLVTPGPLATDIPAPRLIDASATPAPNDTTAPITHMQPLPPNSPPTFPVQWGGEDDTGIARYLVWVRVGSSEWQLWQETTATQAEYAGEPGTLYEFAVWAVDVAGNWSPNSDLQVQAYTFVNE